MSSFCFYLIYLQAELSLQKCEMCEIPTNNLFSASPYICYTRTYVFFVLPLFLISSIIRIGESKVSHAYRGNRQNLAYRFNIFDHIGISSTLRSAKQTSFPRCYDRLGEPTLFQVEAFSPRDCPRDDLWPCKNKKKHGMSVNDQKVVDWMGHKL